MRTTLNIPNSLINDLIRETGDSNKTRLISTALKEMLRSIRRKKLINLGGKMELDFNETELFNERAKDMI